MDQRNVERGRHRLRQRVAAVLVLLLASSGAVADDAAGQNPYADRFEILGVGNIVWVDRVRPLVASASASDDDFLDRMIEEIAEAAFYAAQEFEDVPEKHVFVLIDGKHGNFANGAAAYVGPETMDATFTRKSNGEWETDFGVFAEDVVLAPCMPEDIETLRSNRAGMVGMLESATEDQAAADDEVDRVVADAASQLTLVLLAIQIADSIEQLNPPDYVLGEATGSGDILVRRGEFWKRPMDRRFSIERTGDVVWVDVNFPFEANTGTMPYFVSLAYAYAHMKLGDELVGTTICVLAENKDSRGYVTVASWDRIRAAFKRLPGWGPTVNHTAIDLGASGSMATAEEIDAFRDIRDGMLASGDVPDDVVRRVTRRVQSGERGLWITVAASPAAATGWLPAQDFALAEVTFFSRSGRFVPLSLESRFGMAFSVRAAYRQMPFVIESGDRYPLVEGGFDRADSEITVTSDEIVLGYSLGLGFRNWRLDVAQTVIPITLLTRSEDETVDTESVVRDARFLGGISYATGVAARVAGIYGSVSVDWGQWAFGSGSILIGLNLGFSLKTGFRFRGGGF